MLGKWYTKSQKFAFLIYALQYFEQHFSLPFSILPHVFPGLILHNFRGYGFNINMNEKAQIMNYVTSLPCLCEYKFIHLNETSLERGIINKMRPKLKQGIAGNKY